MDYYYYHWQTNNNYFVLEDQSPETTVNVSVTAYTRWYSSEASPVEMIVSDSRSELLLSLACVWECSMGIAI